MGGRVTQVAVAVAVAATLLLAVTSQADALDDAFEPEPEAGPVLPVEDSDLKLPDGKPLPELPLSLNGEWEGPDLRLVPYKVDFSLKGNAFAGKITLPNLPIVLPLTVQGHQQGSILEFSVRANDTEVVYFAGHLAGTNLVGNFESVTGQRGQWAGDWAPETIKFNEQLQE